MCFGLTKIEYLSYPKVNMYDIFSFHSVLFSVLFLSIEWDDRKKKKERCLEIVFTIHKQNKKIQPCHHFEIFFLLFSTLLDWINGKRKEKKHVILEINNVIWYTHTNQPIVWDKRIFIIVFLTMLLLSNLGKNSIIINTHWMTV